LEKFPIYSIYYFPGDEKVFTEVGKNVIYYLNNKYGENTAKVQNFIDTNSINILFGFNSLFHKTCKILYKIYVTLKTIFLIIPLNRLVNYFYIK
jgi:hypothetical protein